MFELDEVPVACPGGPDKNYLFVVIPRVSFPVILSSDKRGKRLSESWQLIFNL